MDVVRLEDYLREMQMHKLSDQDAAALFSPQRKVYVAHLLNY
jgi:hypothetical protein